MDDQTREQLWAPAPWPVATPEPVPPRRRRGVWIAVVAVVVLIAGAVAAVVNSTSSSDHADARVVLRQAASRTVAATTAHVEETVLVDAPGASQRPMTMTGDNDFGHHESTLTISSGTLPGFEIRTIRGTVYERLPMVSLPGGKHWVKFSAADRKRAGADTLRNSLGSTDPTTGLQYLNAIAGEPKLVGDTTEDGVAVTEYSFTIDLREVFEKLGKAGRALGAGNFSDLLDKVGDTFDVSKIPGRAWIDHDGRVRHFQVMFNLQAAGIGVNTTSDLRYSRFGEPVSVDAPPPGDTVSFSDVPHLYEQLFGSVIPKS
jgi:hypothetical protein